MSRISKDVNLEQELLYTSNKQMYKSPSFICKVTTFFENFNNVATL